MMDTKSKVFMKGRFTGAFSLKTAAVDALQPEVFLFQIQKVQKAVDGIDSAALSMITLGFVAG